MQKAIYKITNLLNNKIYIGQTIHPNKRWWEHNQKANTYADNYPIHLAIAKYGKDNFSFEILEWTEDYDNRERELIKEYNSLVPYGYNLIEGGHSPILVGEEHPRNKVSNKILPLIIKDLQDNILTEREIAKKYHLTDKIIGDINQGTTHIIPNLQYPLRKRTGIQKLTQEQVIEIKKLLKTTNKSYTEIATMFNVTKGNISQINAGRTFKDKNEVYPIRRNSKL